VRVDRGQILGQQAHAVPLAAVGLVGAEQTQVEVRLAGPDRVEPGHDLEDAVGGLAAGGGQQQALQLGLLGAGQLDPARRNPHRDRLTAGGQERPRIAQHARDVEAPQPGRLLGSARGIHRRTS
jgi:hypothetical protein